MKHLILCVLFCFPVFSFAAGFEKADMWSGHYTGIANAAVSSVVGAESTYFNPAGLTTGQGTEISLNFSPSLSKFTGPFTGNTIEKGRQLFSPFMGILGSYSPTKNLGFGVGYYVSGASRSKFNNVNFSSSDPDFGTITNEAEGKMSLTEWGFSAAYRFMKNFKIGATWRISKVDAAFTSLSVTTLGGKPTLINSKLDELKDTNYSNYRLGLQYTPKDNNWGLGISYRSNIKMVTEGTSSGWLRRNGTTSNLIGDTVSVGSDFPTQISVGGHYKFNLTNTSFLQYDWTDYSRDTQLTINGTLKTPVALGNANLIRNIIFSWRNMHAIRVGHEYALTDSIKLRAGYTWVSQVTPPLRARATIGSPGSGHVIGLGGGYTTPSGNTDLNLTYGYAWAGGTTIESDNNVETGVKSWGEYSSRCHSLHMGANFRF